MSVSSPEPVMVAAAVGFSRQIPGTTLAFSRLTQGLIPILIMIVIREVGRLLFLLPLTRWEPGLTRIFTTQLTRVQAVTCWTRPCRFIVARKPTCRLTRQALARCSSLQLLRVRRQILRIDTSFRDLILQQAVATIEGAVLTEAAQRLKVVADRLIKARIKTFIR